MVFSELYWSYWSFRGYFGHFRGSVLFWSLLCFWGYFGYFLVFEVIFIILGVPCVFLGLFWPFLNF